MTLNGGGTISNQYSYFGHSANLGLNFTANVVDYNTTYDPSNLSAQGATVYLQNNYSITSGTASGFSSSFFAQNGSAGIQNYAANRASSPQLTNGNIWTGSISNYYGLLLESSNSGVNPLPNNITNRYGVYQKGSSDINYLEGKLGLKTNTPGSTLDIGSGNFRISGNGSLSGYGGVEFVNEAFYGLKVASYKYQFNATDGTTNYMTIDGGNVGIGTTSPSQLLTVYNGSTTGTYTVSGWLSSSDGRLKSNIKNIISPMEIVKKLNGVYFNWTNNKEAGRQLGFIAQDVRKVLPEAVSGKEGDISKGEVLSMAYQNIVPVLVEALKEKDKEIQGIKQKLDSLIGTLSSLPKASAQYKTNLGENFGPMLDVKQNVPNPFASSTTISYSISQPGLVSIELYNVSGARVKSIETASKEPGTYNAVIDGANLSAGNYIYIVRLNGQQVTKRAVKL